MSDILQIDQSGVLTPDRQTTLYYDFPESVCITPQVRKVRTGGEISRFAVAGIADESNAQGVYFHKGLQAWILRPIQTRISDFSEFDKIPNSLIDLGRFNAPRYDGTKGGLDEEYTWRRPEEILPVSLFEKYARVGDKFIVKKNTPGVEGWTAEMPTDYKLPADVPPDRIAESKETFPADQGYFLRWTVAGTVRNTPATIFNVYFGQFILGLDGDGIARLHERPPDMAAEVLSYKKRFQFRYAQPGKICQVQHTLAIWPCRDRLGRRYIAFSDTDADAVGQGLTLSYSDNPALPTSDALYAIDSGARGDDVDLSPGFSTEAAPLRFDMRRDVKIDFQVSTLAYATEGTLIDLPESLQPAFDASAQVSVQITALTPDGTSIVPTVKDADTLLPFDPTADRHPYVEFSFTSDGQQTPVLYGYSLYRPPIVATINPGVQSVQGHERVEVQGFGGEASSHQAVYDFHDAQAIHPRLRERGRLSAKIVTTFRPAPGADIESTVLHRGIIVRPQHEKKGKDWSAFGSLYPSADWHRLSLRLMSMWKRLDERVESRTDRMYWQDFSAPKDPFLDIYPPWKTTSVIIDLLMAAGFAPSEINIPDLPVRLWPGGGNTPPELTIHPTHGYAEIIQALARNYLGAYLFFDPNSGDTGQWRLLFGTPLNAPPIFQFVSNAPAGAIPTILASYPANTAPVLSPISGYNIPPDFNLVYVKTCLGFDADNWLGYENFLHNPYSCNVPGFAEIADPDHPDYIGYCVPLVMLDPSLAGGASGRYSAAEMTQAAVNMVMNRLYDFTCHTQKLKRFVGPLCFIQDPAIGNKWRPLQFQDPVLLDGVPYLVRSVDIDYKYEHQQMATYELIRPIASL